MPPANWPGYNRCNSTCHEGPSNCSDGSCSKNHWINRGEVSPHEAVHSSEGYGMP